MENPMLTNIFSTVKYIYEDNKRAIMALERIAKALESANNITLYPILMQAKGPHYIPTSSGSDNDPVQCEHEWVSNGIVRYCVFCRKEEIL